MDYDVFFTRLNRPIAWVLRSPLHWLLSPGLALLTITGRKTGHRYTIPVGYQRDGERVTVMVSKARRKSWWRNFREPGPVEIRLHGRARRGLAEVVAPGSEEFRHSAAETLRRLPWLGRQFGIEYKRRQGLSAEQLKVLGEEIAVVRIALEASSR